MEETYGRNRDSIADIETRLQDIISTHPYAIPGTDPEDEPTVPSRFMVDIFRTFQSEYGGQLLDDNELELIAQFVEQSETIDFVSPSMLLGFIAQKTNTSPSPPSSQENLEFRGREELSIGGSASRNSSTDSTRTSNAYGGGGGSRPPSRGPPATPRAPSALDRRQRSTPLGQQMNAPSSWSRPTPKRRKSDAGSRSDSESSGPPSAFGMSGGRVRAPSNPTSPTMGFMSPPSSARSPNFPGSRPGSRSGRYNTNNGYSSPEEGYDPSSSHEHFMASISSLPMPSHEDDDYDHMNDDEDDTLGLIHDRRSSTISLEPLDKVDVLQKTNDELSRKLMEAERSLTQRINEHENELEDLQARLDEVRSELTATKREEKELRSKERINQSQIAELENEVNKLSRNLETARVNYDNMQRMYRAQADETKERRAELTEREVLIQSLREAASVHEVEVDRYAKELVEAEERIHRLETELNVAARAQEELDQQKQENLLLKETIDRMKFDLDELRNKETWNGRNSGYSSAVNTMSKSLGAELSAKLKDGSWNMDDDLSKEEDEVEEISEGEEDEDVVQTIITRKKRKVASRANQPEIMETLSYEEVKEYSDSSTQYDPTLFRATSSTQTNPEPKVITASVQTVPPPPHSSFAVQTNPQPSKGEMQIQTDEVEEEGGSSSSSTVQPPTPKPTIPELPPAYGDEPADLRLAMETLKQWHQGAELPLNKNLHLSPEVAAEWRALKEELGFGCKVIDQAIDASSPSEEGPSSSASANRNGKRRASSKFYNIYNTYVYDKSSSNIPHVTQAVMWAAFAGLAMYMNMHLTYPHPGSPTLHDRQAWQSFNQIGAAGEGFGGAMDGFGFGGGDEGASLVWDLLGRVGGGAARIARGWPT
ncbi:hypothetical protein DL96DRAFT_1667632 [Flagelloscypha sp. PMI_526]|nr:hypothetical protein DL96DRAFT_1667632 [Flagelloscypha sp. PMI_526]